jgi:hypothetical protein
MGREERTRIISLKERTGRGQLERIDLLTSPQIVTCVGDPPNCSICFWTNFKANCWSRRPRLRAPCSAISLPARNPKAPNRYSAGRTGREQGLRKFRIECGQGKGRLEGTEMEMDERIVTRMSLPSATSMTRSPSYLEPFPYWNPPPCIHLQPEEGMRAYQCCQTQK